MQHSTRSALSLRRAGIDRVRVWCGLAMAPCGPARRARRRWPAAWQAERRMGHRGRATASGARRSGIWKLASSENTKEEANHGNQDYKGCLVVGITPVSQVHGARTAGITGQSLVPTGGLPTPEGGPWGPRA